MSYEITLHIPDESTAVRQIESLAESERISPAEAAIKLLEASAKSALKPASPAARRIIGLFSSDDDALMDEVMASVNAERMKRNSEPPRV